MRRSSKRAKVANIPLLSHFQVIADRSGSMKDMGAVPVEKLKKLIEEQQEISKKTGGNIEMSITTFDTKVENWYENVNIKDLEISEAKWDAMMRPRGSTRLIDAIIERVLVQKKYIKNFESELSKEVKGLNPEIKASVIVLTDGKDNSSDRSPRELKKVMEKVQGEGTIALFLAANQDAIMEGKNFGFSGDKCITYGADGERVGSAMDAMSRICRDISDGGPPPPTGYGFSSLDRENSAPLSPPDLDWREGLPPPPPARSGLVRQGADSYNVDEFPPSMYANPHFNRENNRILRPPSPLDSPPSCKTPKSSHVSPINNNNNNTLPSYDFKEEQAIQALLSLKRS